MARTILHVDLDAFFCSVEERIDPSLTGKAFVVAGSAERRGVVSSASYPARKFGIRSAMPTSRALRLHPGLIILPVRHHLYGEESDRIMSVLRDSAPLVEQISIDEAFLDVSDDPRSGGEIAAVLQAEIRQRFGLPTSWGVAPSKLVAKIATEVGKPNGLVVVPPADVATFLAPLPVGMLWGVGPKTQAFFHKEGILTIGALAGLSDARLKELFGGRGPELASHARGEDDRPVVEEREARSMSSETTFARDLADERVLKQTLRGQSEEVGRRLREAQQAGNTVRIKVRWSDFSTITRQARLSQPTDQDGEIYRAAQALFDKAWHKGRPVRLLGVGVSGLEAPVRQLSLFDRTWEQDVRLLKAVDQIRSRFGDQALQRAGSLPKKSPRKVDRP